MLEVCSKQQYRRTEHIIAFLNKEAKHNKVSLNELIGIVTKQVNYKSDKKASQVGEQLVTEKYKSHNSI